IVSSRIINDLYANLKTRAFIPRSQTVVAVLFLFLLALCSCSRKDEAPAPPAAPASDPLDEAKLLSEQGKYEEALQKHIWLHDHVLEQQPAYYGVRLSFALSEWMELGKKYPKALEALKDIRDKKTARLVAGEQDVNLFDDVQSINEHLDEPAATVD